MLRGFFIYREGREGREVEVNIARRVAAENS